MNCRIWPLLPLLALSTAGALTVQVRWSVPEPRLVQGQVQRPTEHHTLTVRLPPDLPGRAPAARAAALRGAGATLAARVSRAPQDIRFQPAAGGWVGAARTGWTVTPAAAQAALSAAVTRTGRVNGPVTVTLPVALTAPVRSVRWAAGQRLTHLGGGESNFNGSPDFRVHNIRVGAARLHGQWTAPGGTLDFNALTGPVSAARGFRPGYVLAGGSLRLEDGGGICQVSTTLFRAALRAGLPIPERHAHSVQVAYYGQPGLDAAVYAGSKNLRVRNDTGAPLLVQFRWDTRAGTLRADLFGRNDGRTVRVEGAPMSRVQMAPGPAFVRAPDLARGETRRIDMPAPGGVTLITRTVTRPGQATRTDRFRSEYRPWGGVIAVPPGDPRG
ncbi:VanW family protein [Deinococcus sp. RM]|uniref:VanW family protein n=1 Tax=Deinococcus sp. RM TaxID=2316359 RepID=UPI003AB32B69